MRIVTFATCLTPAAITVQADPERGFEEVRRAVDEFNRAGFVPEWDEIGTTSETFKLEHTPPKNQGLSFFHSDGAFYWLGHTDLRRALELARRLEMPEASTFAQLKACRGALAKLQAEAGRGTAQPKKQP